MINASEDQLREKYHRADFTIYPSVYEGFGLPIVESLQFNTPIICSNTSSMKELADEFGLPTFDPYNVEDMAMAMEEMIMDKNKRISIMDNVKKVKPYSWNDYAIDLLKIL
jgi:glycosyltransferase involved in cell wall biosynthesis